ncbi:MAG: hypothetical protein ACRCZ9_12425 [Fusobacteriaceae bacterium]
MKDKSIAQLQNLFKNEEIRIACFLIMEESPVNNNQEKMDLLMVSYFYPVLLKASIQYILDMIIDSVGSVNEMADSLKTVVLMKAIKRAVKEITAATKE